MGAAVPTRPGGTTRNSPSVLELDSHAAPCASRLPRGELPLYHTTIYLVRHLVMLEPLAEAVRRGRLQTDLSHYCNVTVVSVGIKGLSGRHMCAHPQICRAYFYPFTSIWASYAVKPPFITLFHPAPATKHARYFPNVVFQEKNK